MADQEISLLAKREEQILAFWKEKKIFEKTLTRPAPRGEFILYDGPPFATGLPHFGHLLPSTIKDAIPRYRTMQGWRVPRRWGWDCHGLPIENLIEQELGFKTKRDIEQYGIDKFNRAARDAVLRYADDWKHIIPRLGRWVDMENDYRTMDVSYTQGVWWAFKSLYNRGLIYEGFKAMHFCPRCSTTLANFEVAQGYKDIEDFAVTVKLPFVEEAHTALLIWTTTPWTLPGNTAAAVNANATYIKIKVGMEFFILAKERLDSLDIPTAEVVAEFKGKELVGKKYQPPFDYFKDQLHKHKMHAFKVYAAPFVTLDSGTGIVHIAPAYGEDDLKLAQNEKIPLIHHVTEEGKFITTVKDFEHLPVKPKGRHMETDAKIISYLKEHDLLVKEEKITHAYPHCWRCDTPLLNWAANSWFVKVSAIKPALLAQNAHIQWVPEHVGTGRFHNGLQSAPDWAISRTRFWGAPLPVWRHSKTKEIKVIGSVEELLSMVRTSGNSYFLMRHGEAHSNVAKIFDSSGKGDNHLTEQGKQTVTRTAEKIRQHVSIDLLIVSPILRAQETARIVQKKFNLPDTAVMTDERLREIDAGSFDGTSVSDWKKTYATYAERFVHASGGGETYADVRVRAGEFLFEIESRYIGKNILIITHESPAWLMHAVAAHKSIQELSVQEDPAPFLQPGEYTALLFTPYPRNENYELDVHRPYIDQIPLGDSLNGVWQRVPDVFDCWFESGSMPFASNQYPTHHDSFDPMRLFGLWPKGYPAHFISESIDQTRGWFYSLIVLGVALFGRSPYQHVITNGTVLAQDGRKMSKRLKNYPELLEVVNRTGADAMRYFLLSSSVIRGEDISFSLQGVEDVAKKLLMRLDNVRSFYDLYRDETKRSATSTHVLDRWILSRLAEVITETTKGFESYQLDMATRPLSVFIDDLSTWYLRRSRDRFKEEGSDKTVALGVLRYVLYILSHVMAPITPFFAEDLFLRIKEEGDTESVHLSSWPTMMTIDTALLTDMKHIRSLSSQALQMREKAHMKIRQPLATLRVKQLPSDIELRALIADELNVKEIIEDLSLQEEILLDVMLTPLLREEGMFRDCVRRVQDLRKKEGFTIHDRPTLVVATNTEGKEFFERMRTLFISETGLSDLVITTGGEIEEQMPFPLSFNFVR